MATECLNLNNPYDVIVEQVNKNRTARIADEVAEVKQEYQNFMATLLERVKQYNEVTVPTDQFCYKMSRTPLDETVKKLTEMGFHVKGFEVTGVPSEIHLG